MNNQTELEKAKMALSSILCNRPIAYHVQFARVGGGATAGLFLSQLFFWSGRGKDKESGWIYKTQSEWTSETGLTRREQETARKNLRKRGLIEEKRKDIPARLYYRPNLDVLIDLLSQNPDGDCAKQEWRNAPNWNGGMRQTGMAECAKLEKHQASLQNSLPPEVPEDGTKLAVSESTSETTTNNHQSEPGSPETPAGETPAKKDDSGKSETKDSNNPSQTSFGESESESLHPPTEKPFPPPECTGFLTAISDCFSEFNIGMELATDTTKVPNIRTAVAWWRKYPLECMRDGISATVANAEKSNVNINFKPLKYFEPEIIKAFETYNEALEAKEAARQLREATSKRIAKQKAEQEQQANEPQAELPRTLAAAAAANGGNR